MAKTVSESFKAAWLNKSKISIQQIQYKRRYWTGSAFAYESEWNTLTAKEFTKIGTITWKLDFPSMNVIKSSNVTIYLDNKFGKWLPTNTAGVFGSDATSPEGYEPFLTKFRIRYGLILADQTSEFVTLFTGQSIDFIPESDNPHIIEITLEGIEYNLRTADAQKVSDVFTNESTIPATGDGTNKIFVTTSVGIFFVGTVRVDGVEKTQGDDYSISYLGDPTQGAQITFKEAPLDTLPVDASGKKWKLTKKIDELVGLLCDEAGIAEGDRTINPVIFPGGLSGRKIWNSQEEWEAAGNIFTNVESSSIPGNIARLWFLIDDFTDDYTSNPTWTVINGTWSVVSNTLRGGTASSLISTPFSKSTGTWECKFRFGSTTSLAFMRFAFMSSAQAVIFNGYQVEANDTGGNKYYRLFRVDAGFRTELGLWVGPSDVSWHTVRITRTTSGNMNVYIDGTLRISATDTNYNTSNYILAQAIAVYIYFDDFYWSQAIEDTVAATNVQAIWQSAEQDLLVAPTAWGKLEYIEVLNGGTINYETAVASVSGGPYDAWIEIAPDGQIQSALKQYFKVRIKINPLANSFNTPYVDKVTVNYTTATVFLAIANFTGKTVFTAIQRLAQLCDYEFGFTSDAKFFFRSKVVSGSPTLELSQENGIIQIQNWNLGYGNIINLGQIKYRDYYNEYGATEAGETPPTSEDRFGLLIRHEDWSDLMVSTDINLAKARAQLLYENNYLPKKTFSIPSKMCPHLDLSDIVRVNFFDRPAEKENLGGDPAIDAGDAPAGLPTNTLARDLDCKVVGISYQPQNETCSLDVQEVLT